MKCNIKLALLLVQALLLTLSLSAFAETYDGFNRSRWQIVVNGSNPVVKETNNRLEILLPADSMDSPIAGTFNALVSAISIQRTSFSQHDVFPASEVYLIDFGGIIATTVPTADTRGRLRLERVGNILTGYYFDSQLDNWQAISSATYTTGDVFFSIAAWSHDYAFDDKDVRVAFDRVFIEKGTLRGQCES